MYKFIISFAITALFLACNKDQSAVKKLDGTWEATEYRYTDSDTMFTITKSDLFKFELTFNECKLKDDTWCENSQFIIFDGDTSTYNGIFNVKNDGETLVITNPDHIEELGWTSQFRIVTLKKKEMILDNINIDDEDQIFIMKPKS